MKLIVGLGNPGKKYETTRHNIGFLCADFLVDEWKAQGPTIKNKAEVWQVTLNLPEGKEPALILKPQTFMNLSGRAVSEFYSFYKCKPEDLLVIYDELDIPPGEIRIKQGGSNGGHNGLKSIDECIGSDQTNYFRFRLGIGHPRALNLPHDVSDYVLGGIPDQQWDALEDLFKSVKGAIELTFSGKIKEAQNKIHGKVFLK